MVINKWNINPAGSSRIEKWANHKLLGKIAYDKRIFQAIAKLKPITKTKLPARSQIEKIYTKLERIL